MSDVFSDAGTCCYAAVLVMVVTWVVCVGGSCRVWLVCGGVFGG